MKLYLRPSASGLLPMGRTVVLFSTGSPARDADAPCLAEISGILPDHAARAKQMVVTVEHLNCRHSAGGVEVAGLFAAVATPVSFWCHRCGCCRWCRPPRWPNRWGSPVAGADAGLDRAATRMAHRVKGACGSGPPIGRCDQLQAPLLPWSMVPAVVGPPLAMNPCGTDACPRNIRDNGLN